MNVELRWSITFFLATALSLASPVDAQVLDRLKERAKREAGQAAAKARAAVAATTDSTSRAMSDSVACVIGDGGCERRAKSQGKQVVVTDSSGKPLSQREIAAARRAAMRNPSARATAEPVSRQGRGGEAAGPSWAGPPVANARFASLTMVKGSYIDPTAWACGLTAQGEALCWGSLPEIGTELPVPVQPTLSLKTITLGGGPINHLGKPFGCGLDAEGHAHCWGAPLGGVISKVRQSKGASPEEILEPMRNPEQPRRIAGGHRFVQLAHGLGTACGLTAAGEVYCWGVGILAQKLDPRADEPYGILEPIRLRFPGKVSDIAVGSGYIGGLVDGRFHRWASNGTRAIAGPSLRSIAGGTAHVCGLDASGAAYCWGVDGTGQLGRGVLSEELCNGDRCGSTFAPVAGDLRFRTISAGTFHSCALTASDEAYCWGYNEHGQLGTDGGSAQCTLLSHESSEMALRYGSAEMKEQARNAMKPCSVGPVAVQGGLRFREIAPGTMQTCALDAGGKAYCWGLLGTRLDQRSSRPVPVGN